MDRTDAIRALVAAGKRQELINMISEAANRAAGRYAEISGDTGRTEEWKMQTLATAYEGVRAQVDKEIQSMASAAAGGDRDDAGRVLGVAGLPGDPASLAISRRDAEDRVANVGSTPELMDLLNRATRSGDEVLARAVAAKALQDRNAEVMNRFIENRPEIEAAAERLWKAEEASNNTFDVAMQLAALLPPELFGMSSWNIGALAAAG